MTKLPTEPVLASVLWCLWSVASGYSRRKEAGTLEASDKQARDCLQIPFGMKYRLGGSAPELGM